MRSGGEGAFDASLVPAFEAGLQARYRLGAHHGDHGEARGGASADAVLIVADSVDELIARAG
jgi:hypothetical protein